MSQRARASRRGCEAASVAAGICRDQEQGQGQSAKCKAVTSWLSRSRSTARLHGRRILQLPMPCTACGETGSNILHRARATIHAAVGFEQTVWILCFRQHIGLWPAAEKNHKCRQDLLADASAVGKHQRGRCGSAGGRREKPLKWPKGTPASLNVTGAERRKEENGNSGPTKSRRSSLG